MQLVSSTRHYHKLNLEVTRYPRGEQSPAQAQSALELQRRLFIAARRQGWANVSVGVELGYKPMFNDDVHYMSTALLESARGRGVAKEAETTWRQPGLALDPDHPEYLLYSQVLGRRVLVGVMYMMPLGVEGPQLGGARTVWHFHLFPAGLCFVGGVVPVGNRNAAGGCTAGAAPRHRSAEMMHVWLLPPPVSPFASSMECPLEATSDGTPEGNLRTAEAAPGPKRKQVSPEERFRELLPSLLERRMKEHGF